MQSRGAGAVFYFGRGNGDPAGTALSKPKMKFIVVLGRKREINTRNRTEEQDYQFCLLASSHILSVTTLVLLNLLFIKSCSVDCSIKRKQLTTGNTLTKTGLLIFIHISTSCIFSLNTVSFIKNANFYHCLICRECTLIC